METRGFLKFLAYVSTTPRDKVIDELCEFFDEKNKDDIKNMDDNFQEMMDYFTNDKKFGSLFDKDKDE